MSTTTMHFGPEWMRAKPQPSPKIHPPPSPPANTASASTYSALVSPAGPAQADQRDVSHPFRYSKDDLLRIYQEGGGKTALARSKYPRESSCSESMKQARQRLGASAASSRLRIYKI